MISRRLLLSVLLFGLASSSAKADIVAGFEDQNLAANSSKNNAGVAGGFTSSGMFFNNSFSVQTFGGVDYEVWSGWAISNKSVTVSESVSPQTTNQYSDFQFDAYPAMGAGGSATYGIGYSSGFSNLPGGSRPVSIDVANTLYAYLAMVKGNQFSTAFHAGSFFSLIINGYAGLGGTGATVGTAVTFDLARYTTDNDRPKSVWSTVDLTNLNGARSLGFSFASSDVGSFGINTPVYFAADNLRVVPEPASWLLGLIGGSFVVSLARRRVLAN